MSSGSLKDLTRAISSTVNTSAFPLPASLLEILHNYLEKHPAPDDDHSRRLQDDLLSIHAAQVANNPVRLAPFLSLLGILKPAIRGSGRLLQWWQTLSGDVIKNIGSQKGLAQEAREIILGLLVVEDDEDSKESEILQDAKATAHTVGESLVTTWMLKNKSALEGLDQQAQFVEVQVQHILFAFGRRRPKDFLISINQFFVERETRIRALTLLCEFIRHQPPHLHQMLQTPLFDNLLRCLQIDTSTRVISLAMTALVMFLPHIPSSLGPYLPALFDIYRRMLFWDRERKVSEPLVTPSQHDDETVEKRPNSGLSNTWVKLSYLLDSDDETVPELLHYFTFLYGLYPLNFMSYIRKPQKYLRNANFPGADEIDIEASEFRQRSETFRLVHLLHPNFFHLTIESELTDTHRWINSEPADVVAECMGLFTPGDDHEKQGSRTRGPTQKLNLDIPTQALLGDNPPSQLSSTHASWRDPRHTTLTSPDDSLHKTFSRNSHTSQNLSPLADSPTLPPIGSDSPTIPPQMLNSTTANQLSDLLSSQRSARGSVANDSMASLSLTNTHQDPPPIDFLSPLDRDSIPRTLSNGTEPISAAVKIAYLHREIQLLRNDLNMEQYLKAQHLSHIGLLRRKQLREARIEAETQNLINSNRQLKSKIEEAKRVSLQTKKETEKSKAHARKWEIDLSNRLRVLRDEQRKTIAERDELKSDLASARKDNYTLKSLVVNSEAKELGSRQTAKIAEGSHTELRRLRADNDRLAANLQAHEANENLAAKAVENEESARREVRLLQMLLQARDRELQLSKQAFDKAICEAHDHDGVSEDSQSQLKSNSTTVSKEIFDSALASARNRAAEAQNSYNHLQKRYTALHSQHMDLKVAVEEGGYERPLLGDSPPQQQFIQHASNSPPSISRSLSKRLNPSLEAHSWDSSNVVASSNSPSRALRVDTARTASTISPPLASPSSFVPPDGKSPVMVGGGVSHFMGSEPFLSMIRPSSKGKERETAKVEVAKVKPQSEVRMYGRGGVQNIGKNVKDKKDKSKEEDGEGKDGKEKKKSSGLRGIRGFV